MDKPVLAVEYPVLTNIKSLGNKNEDYYVSPFVTGYSFNNPTENFNNTSCIGITRDSGLYPSGWNYPMQFQAYYQKDNGGFYMVTEDGNADPSIKSFTFIGSGDSTCRSSIWHYVSDLGQKSVDFDYDIKISAINEGSWYAVAEKYKQWANQQTWCTQRGTKSERTDINKSFYEETSLVDFCLLNFKGYTVDIYNKTKEYIDGRYMFTALNASTLNGGYTDTVYSHYEANRNSTAFYDLQEENGDLNLFFEFPSFYSRDDQASSKYKNEEFIDNLMLDSSGRLPYYAYGGGVCDYVCPGCDSWTATQLTKDNIYIKQCGADGVYHDVGIGAGMPKSCYNTSHAHGTYVNMIPAALQQVKLFADNAHKQGGIYGQELIFEQMLPYMDFYQCRANADELSNMEHSRIMPLVENGSAEKIHLFEYIYFEYGAVRVDGYIFPEKVVGDAYYHIVAFTGLNGGIVEYNYENTLNSSRKREPYAQDMDVDMMKFLNKVASARLNYATDYLVYGQMCRVPELEFGQSTYNYYIYRYNDDLKLTDWSGNATVDNVVISAFSYDGKIALFMCNITENDINTNVSFDASIYGIQNGNISYYLDGTLVSANNAKITNGQVNLNLNLTSRDVVMLILENE